MGNTVFPPGEKYRKVAKRLYSTTEIFALLLSAVRTIYRVYVNGSLP